MLVVLRRTAKTSFLTSIGRTCAQAAPQACVSATVDPLTAIAVAHMATAQAPTANGVTNKYNGQPASATKQVISLLIASSTVDSS